MASELSRSLERLGSEALRHVARGSINKEWNKGTDERRRETWNAFNKKKVSTPEGKAQKVVEDKLYRARAGFHPRRQWERWEDVYIFALKPSRTYRDLAFSLQRGWGSVYQRYLSLSIATRTGEVSQGARPVKPEEVEEMLKAIAKS